MERRTAGHKRLDKRTRDEYVCDQWRCLNHLLKVVEHEQQFLVGKVSAQLIRKGPSCFPSHAQRLGDGGQDKSMIVDGLQPDKNETVGKACLYRSGDLLRKSGLPNARRTCEVSRRVSGCANSSAMAVSSRSRPMSGVSGLRTPLG